MGGIYALGYTANELEKMAKSQDWEQLLSDDIPRLYQSYYDRTLKQRYLLSVPFSEENRKLEIPEGVVRGQNVLNLFCGLAANVPENYDFKDLPIPFSCVAGDLETGKEVILQSGSLPKAIFSSMAIPGAFHPVEFEEKYLVDGGIVNNFPAEVAKDLGADILIGVDLETGFLKKEEFASMGDVFNQLIYFFDQAVDSINKNLCNLMIHPDMKGFGTGSFSSEAVDSLIRRGEEAARKMIPELRNLKSKHHLVWNVRSRELVDKQKWNILSLRFPKEFHDQKLSLHRAIGLSLPGEYTYADIKDGIDRLYGQGLYEKIYFNLEKQEEDYILNLHISQKKVSVFNFGFSANTFDAAKLSVNYTLKNNSSLIDLLGLSGEISANPAFNLILETGTGNLPKAGFQLNFKMQDFDVYEGTEKLYNTETRYASANLYLYRQYMKKYLFELGMTEEYYNGDVFVKQPSEMPTEGEDGTFITQGYISFHIDDLENFYFPSHGSSFEAKFALLSAIRSRTPVTPILKMNWKKIIPLKENTSLLLNFHNRYLFNNNFPYYKINLAGGSEYAIYFQNHLPFTGLPSVTVVSNFANIASTGFQFQLAKFHFLTLTGNVLFHYDKWLEWESDNFVVGGGLTYKIRTPLGPLETTIGISDQSKKPVFCANFGYWF